MLSLENYRRGIFFSLIVKRLPANKICLFQRKCNFHCVFDEKIKLNNKRNCISLYPYIHTYKNIYKYIYLLFNAMKQLLIKQKIIYIYIYKKP